MKNILEIHIDPFGQGGTQTFIKNIVQNMNRSDLNIDLFSPYYIAEFNRDFVQKNFNIVYTDLLKKNNKNEIEYVKVLNKVLHKHKYDVVHIHTVSTLVMALCSFICKIRRVKKIIVHSHSTGDKNSLKHKSTKIICTPILNVCPTDYFACSKDAAEWKFSKSIVKNKVKIIKNGIDLNKFKIDNNARKVYREKLGYSENDKVLGHVGRFSDEKNHRFIINLFSELKKENDKYKLLLLGDGELRSEIEEYAKQKGVFENIIFTGNVNNVQDYMQAMDLFVFPSKFEGLGIVAIEAQACGLPVIASTGVPLEMKVSENCKFISLNEKNQWIKSINEMINLPKRNNTEQIRQNGYDIYDTAEIMRKIYTE
ncbi:MAG: glycosyltransferase [Clostridia bacterium]|nr:glycosyltransferase [Clostridia bacterium]